MSKYRFADLCIQMNCQHDIMLRRSKKYKTSDTCEELFSLAVPATRIEEQLEIHPELSPAELELIFMGNRFAALILSHQGFVLHASAIQYQNKGILFSADSGVGKSTHTKLWQKHFGVEAVQIINDDKPAIRYVDNTFYVYGTPFSGNSDENLNCKVPLYAIVFLEQAESNSIRKLTTVEAIPRILKQTLRPRNNVVSMDTLLSLLDKLLLSIPVYLLRCNMNEDAAVLASKTIISLRE